MSQIVHYRTPTLNVIDGRGLPVRQVAYWRKDAGGSALALISRQYHDVPGRQVEQWDPRLFGNASKPNLATIYRLSGEPVSVDSVDAGWRLSLAGVAGEVLQRWDVRGTHWQATYDKQLRVIALQENAQPNVERFTYADATADAGNNLRGRITEQLDPAGRLSFDRYSMDGQALGDTRTFAGGESYPSSRIFNALGAVLEQTDAMEHQQLFRYDIAGQLKQMHLKIAPASAPQGILVDAQYNAAGQLVEQQKGNGVVRRWAYDPATGWLTQQQAGLPGRSALQNLNYGYDRVGNVLTIDDQAFARVFFANQLIDGQREFSYDSLYQLRSATGFETDTPNLRPGLPTPITPIDTGRRYNYAQHYEYDTGGNLTTLRHVRAGNNHTLTTRIAPGSNRGVRWMEGEAEPVFDEHFDAHGNLLWLDKGQPLRWNSRDQLAVARLVERSGGPDDEETYVYSQGQRISKRLVTQAQSVSHVREVRYLPGLEIRTLDDDEELHVITAGNVRCLHWVKGRPEFIEQDQLRYSLDDHLGSSTLELDRSGALISQEIYYPFGGTAWWAARSAVEVDYKTIRYSGKEMDVSGLYDYGARYYAPWLQRWISADPGGDVDGLNLYGFVGNNPLNYVDDNGEQRTPAEAMAVLDRYSNLLAEVEPRLDRSLYQLNHLFRTRDIYKAAGKRFALTTTNLFASAITGGTAATLATGATLFTGPLAPVIGLGAAALVADITGNTIDKAASRSGFGYPLLPRSDDYDLGDISQNASPSSLRENVRSLFSKYDPRQIDGQKELLLAGTIGAADTIFATTHLEKSLGMFRLAVEATEALNDSLGQHDLDVLDQSLETLVGFLNTQQNLADEALEDLRSAGGQHIAQASGTEHRLGGIEDVTKGKIQRVYDLSQKLSTRIRQKRAA